jgi:hypothetical protein
MPQFHKQAFFFTFRALTGAAYKKPQLRVAAYPVLRL